MLSMLLALIVCEFIQDLFKFIIPNFQKRREGL